MNLIVRVIAGPDRGQQFDLPAGETLTIGRGRDSDTKIRDPQMSRLHCELRHEPHGCILVDRGGAGGICVNGQKVDGDCEIAVGTIFEAGHSKLRVESFDPLEAATMAGGAPPTVEMTADDWKASGDESMSHLIDHIFGGRFEVIRVVSSSETSVVFFGRDLKHHSDVAIKVLRRRLAGDEVQQERFIRAMKIAIPIKHPNLVRLRMAGRQAGHCWSATDWVEGCDVATLIEEVGVGGMLDWRQTWRAGFQIASALAEAAKHEVVHRNVTPKNLLRRDCDKTFMLNDLSFAKALEHTETDQLTRPGEILGDLNYIAPERIFSPQSIDSRSDQFGLGATLYGLLTGAPPYPAKSLPELIQAFREPVPKAPAIIHMGMDERFSDAVMRMIRVEPDERFPSADELVEQLKRVGTLAGIAS